MAETVRVGLIGAGAFGERHLEAYRRVAGLDVVAVADADIVRARAVAERWGVPRAFSDANELIAECAPAGVSVVTPGDHHLEPTLAALAAGCSVLLEKPIALSSTDVDTITAAEAASSAFVLPAHLLRFAAPYRALRARIQSGGVGRLLGISSRRERGADHVDLFPGIHPAFMSLVHDIDLAIWLSESRAVRVTAHGPGATGGGPPLLVWATVEAEDGSVWSLRTSWVLPAGSAIADRVEVFGTAGAATLDLGSAVTIYGPTVERVDHELTPAGTPGAIDAEVSCFSAGIRQGRAPAEVTLAHAAHGIRIAEAIVASGASGGAPIDVES